MCGHLVKGAYNSLDLHRLRLLFADVPCPKAHISVWEMFAVVVSVRLYESYMAGQYWRVRTDNTQVVAWPMKGDAPPALVSTWLKELATSSVCHRFRLGAKHIPGAANCMADALSRECWVTVRGLLLNWRNSRSADWVAV